MTYSGAESYVRDLRTGGYGDWRLPSSKELEFIFRQKPFFPNTKEPWYFIYAPGYKRQVPVFITDAQRGGAEALIEYSEGRGSVLAVRP